MSSRVRLGEFNFKEYYAGKKTRAREICWYVIKVFFFLSAIPYPYAFKIFLLKIFGAKIGSRLIIKPRVNIHVPWNLEIGNNVWIGEEVLILNFEKVSIGNNVCISQRAFLCGGNHDYKQIDMPYKNGYIILKDGCWIGASSFIGPNVIIGEDSVVSACSVITKSLEENGVYKGNPGSYIKQRWE